MQLSIIIVNFNVKYFLEQCLCSVINSCKNINAEILVVDNNSTDGSKDYLSTKFKTVHFYWNNENVGFAKANNFALSKATGEFILFLNPDTIVAEDCFEKCISFLNSLPTLGALGIKMIDGSGKFLKESKRAFPSPLTSLYKLSGLTKLMPNSKVFGKYHLGHLSKNKNNEVDVLAGAFMMMPKILLDKIGGFDETFFMYGEDVDLSFRIQKAGFKNYYFADSTIIHFKGESTKKGSINYVKLFYNAMSIFVKKHYSGTSASIFNILIQLGILLRATISILANFIKKIGLPLIDAVIIFFSFSSVKYLWNNLVRKEVNYSPNVVIIAIPFFTCLFLIASYFSGLYDKGFKQSQLSKSIITASLIILSVYALLPESARFSRAILFFGILMSYILMNIIRRLFVHWNFISIVDDLSAQKQSIIVSNQQDFEKVTAILHNARKTEKVLGLVCNDNIEIPYKIGNVNQINELIKTYPINEIIYCQSQLSFKEIIDLIQIPYNNISNKFYAQGSSSIVSSDDKNLSGYSVANDNKFIITSSVNKRNKRLFDVLFSVVFLLSFPIHIIYIKNLISFLKNIFSVLFGKKTWVGYATNDTSLPILKHGIISTTTLPKKFNTLPLNSLRLSDEWYATTYTFYLDVKKIIRGYKYLDTLS